VTSLKNHHKGKRVSPFDTNQVAMKMTKEAKDKAHGEQLSQQTIQDPIKDLIDPTRGDGHKPEHQLFFLLVFLRDRICCK